MSATAINVSSGKECFPTYTLTPSENGPASFAISLTRRKSPTEATRNFPGKRFTVVVVCICLCTHKEITLTVLVVKCVVTIVIIIVRGQAFFSWIIYCFSMGGHALSEGLTERKKLAEYCRIKQAVIERFEAHSQGTVRVNSIVEMPGKQDFGDLDLLYIRESGVTSGMVKVLIQSIFAPTEIVTCGQVTSFDFEKFQIDMIECNEMNFDMSHFCLSYGDRGMILGQMARWQV